MIRIILEKELWNRRGTFYLKIRLKINMDDLSPIFILSCERSGSTLLHYILDTHPEISCPGELFLGQLSKLLRLAVSRTTGYVTLGSLEERDETARREVYKILTDLLGKFTKARGKKIWCEKTPYNVNDLTHLDWAFPQARYILLFRQSLDVVQSCLDMPEKATCGGPCLTW